MSIEAMKLALEALENSRDYVYLSPTGDCTWSEQDQLSELAEAITALSQAIEQAQKQDGGCSLCTNGCKACDAKYIYGWPLGKDPRDMTDAELKSAHGITGEQK